MRIVHVTDCYLPRMGGIETQVADLVRHQSAAGHDVHVVTSTTEDADPNAQVHRDRKSTRLNSSHSSPSRMPSSA